MLGVIGILAISVLIVMIDLPVLLKNKAKREMGLYAGLLLLGTGLSIAKALHLYIPNPQDYIADILRPFSELLFGSYHP